MPPMTDNDKITDAELVKDVAALDPKLAEKIRARLVALRLRCIVKPTAPSPAAQPVPH